MGHNNSYFTQGLKTEVKFVHFLESILCWPLLYDRRPFKNECVSMYTEKVNAD